MYIRGTPCAAVGSRAPTFQSAKIMAVSPSAQRWQIVPIAAAAVDRSSSHQQRRKLNIMRGECGFYAIVAN